MKIETANEKRSEAQQGDTDSESKRRYLELAEKFAEVLASAVLLGPCSVP